jgi:hypothetical protein
MHGNFHESLNRDTEVESSSDRAFGLVMAAACCVIAGLSLWRGGSNWPYWTAAAIFFAFAAWRWPAVLGPFNELWLRFGLVLHRVLNPFVMGILFFAVVTPVGLVMRFFDKHTLGLEFDREATSYWFMRDKTESQPGPMTKQY